MGRAVPEALTQGLLSPVESLNSHNHKKQCIYLVIQPEHRFFLSIFLIIIILPVRVL